MTQSLTYAIAPDELALFLEDVNDCLQQMEMGILHLEQQRDPETLNTVFRAAHTLKALAATVGHAPMTELTHTLETLFDSLRNGRLQLNSSISDELLACVDALKQMRNEIVEGQPSGVDIADLLDRLHTIQQGLETAVVHPDTNAPSPLTAEQIALLHQKQTSGETILEITIQASEKAFAPAARLYQAALALAELGDLLIIQPALPDLQDDDDKLHVFLATHTEISEVTLLLDEVEDLGDVSILPYTATVPARHNEAATYMPDTGQEKTVRISVERLDKLMNLVGELVTNRTRLWQIDDMLKAQQRDNDAVHAFSELVPLFSHVVDQLQEEVMHARMLPISTLFNKFPRLVREVARKTNKQVDLVISGEATELDRAVMESVGDPLVHLLRNAVDHGLESPDERVAAGKLAVGTVTLTAASVEGQIVITVTDDGRGIDPVKIRETAVARNILTAEEAAKLTNTEAIELIFLPNLSTNQKVTETSGRGVGLDVVRTNIERLSGSVIVNSTVGQGTSFRITLPLTLALVQTMLVTVNNILYAIPVLGVNGAMYISEATVNHVKGRPVIEWENEITPLLDLREIFVHPKLVNQSANGYKPSIVLVIWGKMQVGLVVDKIIGQQEIVVKSLSPLIGSVMGLSGATILGDGRVAFIVDIPGLINTLLHERRR